MDNVQAAVLHVKLRHLPDWLAHRREIAGLYREGLKNVAELRLPHFTDDRYFDNYQNYVIRTRCRDELRQHLKDQGVETLVHWPKPMWDHKGLELENPGLPETESICNEVISLPMSAETTPEQVQITTACIRDYFAAKPTSAHARVAD